MTGKAVSVETELVPNGKEATRETLSAALAKTDAADVETVFARVEQDIANLPNTVKAFSDARQPAGRRGCGAGA